MLLRQAGTNDNSFTAQIGDVVKIEVVGDLQSVSAAGIALSLTIPDGPFQVIDNGFPGQVGIQPFIEGGLFEGAGVNANALLTESGETDDLFPGLQLDFAQVVGVGANRGRSGTGVVATFDLLCVKPVINGKIQIDDNPVRQTVLVLPDGITERKFRTVRGMEATVIGLELRDIPDVILLPGQKDDSRQIGSLDLYVNNSLVGFDSLKWTFENPIPDSLDIQIDPHTRQVTIMPLNGWSGRQRIIWTATEPSGILPGEAPLSASDFSDVVVNNPPMFRIPRDEDGVKRDTIRILEDSFTYIPGANRRNLQRAFKWQDLDFLVADPDIIDPQVELLFAVLSFGAQTDSATVVGESDPTTHDLLVWTRPDFAGSDSLKILVRDFHSGMDTLHVIVEVEEVPDAPRFILSDSHLRINRGGSFIINLEDFVFDPDTPLNEILLEWDEDPGGNFSVEIDAGEEGFTNFIFRGKTDFIGDGLFVFRAKDPLDPETLSDRLLVNISAAEVLPPVVNPTQIKIDLTPPGVQLDKPKSLFTLFMDDVVDDPDNQDSELSWSLPATHQVLMELDENRVMTVQAPLGFVDYESVTMTVRDPDNQADFLLARIYSSDGRPVSGGLPDLILDRGDIHRAIDLDNYYFDADNIDEEMEWETVDFHSSDLLISIDPLTHIITFEVPERAAFKTESVVLRVTSRPEGISSLDTMQVSIRTGGGGGGDEDGGGDGDGGATVGNFQILALPTELQIPVEAFPNVFNLDDFIVISEELSKESISWDVSGGKHSIPRIADDHTVSIFGFSSGLDTLLFTARDGHGRTEEAAITVRIMDEREVLNLQAIPDVNFIAGKVFNDIKLNDYIIDRETHADSLLEWSVEFIAPDENIFVQVNPDTTIFATAPDTGATQVVFSARNVALEVVGRDTVSVTALDPSLLNETLQDFPPVFFNAGESIVSVNLNDHLPEEILEKTGSNPIVKWNVSGQRITLPIIDPQPPHLLTLQSVGERVGSDTLSFRAMLSGGFNAIGSMVVTVTEPVDSTTVDLQAIPNPLNPSFIDIYIISRRPVETSPTLLSSLAGVDTTIEPVELIEEDLSGRGVLVWAAGAEVPAGVEGTMFFTARVLTAQGTNIQDTTSVAVGTAVAGKAVVVEHEGVQLEVPADAVDQGTRILLMTKAAQRYERAPRMAVGESHGELELGKSINTYPAGLVLRKPGILQLQQVAKSSDGLYQSTAAGWRYIGPADEPVFIEKLGFYGILRDQTPPRIRVVDRPTDWQNSFAAEVTDAGSGVEPKSLNLSLDGIEVEGKFARGRLRWDLPPTLAVGAHTLALEVVDRAGNRAFMSIEFDFAGRVLPRRFELGKNYPNPFNPETTIPFTLPEAWVEGSAVELHIFNASGQLVRKLLKNEYWPPGYYEIRWDGRTETGEPLGSGIYLYRLEARGLARIQRMTLIK